MRLSEGNAFSTCATTMRPLLSIRPVTGIPEVARIRTMYISFASAYHSYARNPCSATSCGSCSYCTCVVQGTPQLSSNRQTHWLDQSRLRNAEHAETTLP